MNERGNVPFVDGGCGGVDPMTRKKMGRKNKVEGSTRGDGNNRGEETKANALALKRMKLQNIEEEIDRRM
jgi:hypothetical protein